MQQAEQGSMKTWTNMDWIPTCWLTVDAIGQEETYVPHSVYLTLVYPADVSKLLYICTSANMKP